MSTIRTYRAASVREALAQVRAELGEDALILGQREVRRRRFPWHRLSIETELTAAVTTATLPAERNQSGQPRRHATEPPARFSAMTLTRSPQEHGREESRSTSLRSRRLDSPLEQEPANRSTIADPFRLYTQLIEQDVDESLARKLVGQAQRDDDNRRQVRNALSDHCRHAAAASVGCSGPIQITPGRRRIAALVGPTGVGKTTTIAKLAANFRLRDRVRVGLITVDTFRVAAVEQLRTYADLIDVPMRVVSSPREMSQALDDLSDVDLVLIDTAGRSPSDDLRIQELRAFLQAAHADEAHLVVSLTSNFSNLSLTVERFSRVGPTSLLLTKLDEAAGPGTILSAANLADLPISYITTGQDVPDDIETASADRIAQWVLPVDAEPDARYQPPSRGAEAESRRYWKVLSTTE